MGRQTVYLSVLWVANNQTLRTTDLKANKPSSILSNYENFSKTITVARLLALLSSKTSAMKCSRIMCSLSDFKKMITLNKTDHIKRSVTVSKNNYDFKRDLPSHEKNEK